MTNPVERAIFSVAAALEVPVLVAALVTVAVVVLECGGLVAEVVSRRGRRLDALLDGCRSAAAAPDETRAGMLVPLARSAAMAVALTEITAALPLPLRDVRIDKALADFDLRSERKLSRTRLLVRVGPALGLMGTLIPLSPALEGLAQGKIAQLTDNLRIAFSVTVLGLLVGAVAFALTLFRDRFYSQDYSDLEYVAAALTGEVPAPAVAPVLPLAAVPQPLREDPA